MRFPSKIDKKIVVKILDWESDFNVKVIISKPSKSRLGVFIPKRFSNHLIRINSNLNKYSFLITLVHEMAHASIWNRYRGKVKPHGLEWKMEFKRMILPFLNPNYFPEDMKPREYYHPVNRGLEIKIAEKLAILRDRDKLADK